MCKFPGVPSLNIFMTTFTYLSDVHFDELDALGVLHHTRYLLHLERAQQKFFEQLLGVDDFNTDRDEDIYVVVHGIEARFRQPLRNRSATSYTNFPDGTLQHSFSLTWWRCFQTSLFRTYSGKYFRKSNGYSVLGHWIWHLNYLCRLLCAIPV